MGVDWPSAGAGPLPFIFSVDCAALPRVDGFGLPADGSLLFFLDHAEDHLAGDTGDRRYARVVYVPADTETEVAEDPSLPAFVGEQYDLRARLGAELPLGSQRTTTRTRATRTTCRPFSSSWPVT